MAEDIILAGLDAGRGNIPGDGIDIAEALASAPPGSTGVGYRILTGICSGPACPAWSAQITMDLFIRADGTVDAGPGYEPVIEDGKLTRLRALAGG